MLTTVCLLLISITIVLTLLAICASSATLEGDFRWRTFTNRGASTSHASPASYWADAGNFPNPVDSPKECGRTNASYLCDPDGMLTQDEGLDPEFHLKEEANGCILPDNKTMCYFEVAWKAEGRSPEISGSPGCCMQIKTRFLCWKCHGTVETDKVDVWLQRLCLETHCACDYCPDNCPGTRVSVLLVRQLPVLHQHSISHSDTSVRQAALTQWASRLRQQAWGFATCHDDIVVIISAQDEFQVYLSVGKTVTRALTQLCVQQMYHWIKPSLDQGNYTWALYLFIQDIRAISLGQHGCQNFQYFMSTGLKIAIIYGATCVPVVGCVVFIFLGPCFRGRGFGGSNHRMDLRSYTRRKEMQDRRKGVL